MNIKSISIDVQGEVDNENSDGFIFIKTIYNIESKDSEDKINKFIDLIEKYCPVKNTLINNPKFYKEINII